MSARTERSLTSVNLESLTGEDPVTLDDLRWLVSQTQDWPADGVIVEIIGTGKVSRVAVIRPTP